MITKRGSGDYPRKYRPCKMSEVYGQEEIKKFIAHGLDSKSLMNSLLFQGVSGTGKTTIARIIAMGLNCRTGSTSEPCGECDICVAVRDGNDFSFQEFNSADVTGIDRLRQESGNFPCSSLNGAEKKIVVFDECHRLSKNAQDYLLKIVEDSHPDLHFILCSTEPKNIKETLRNRCMSMTFEEISYEEMYRLLQDVCDCEEVIPDSDVFEGLIKEAKGMPRNVLFQLQMAVQTGRLKKN